MIRGGALTKNAPREKVVFNRSGEGADHVVKTNVLRSSPHSLILLFLNNQINLFFFFGSGQIIFITALL